MRCLLNVPDKPSMCNRRTVGTWVHSWRKNKWKHGLNGDFWIMPLLAGAYIQSIFNHA